MAVTIRSVAEAAGVSVTTVSFVLNDKRPQVDAISKKTRERVKLCAAALGYHKNAAASALKTGRSLWVGVTLQTLQNEWFARVWAPHETSLLAGIHRTLLENDHFTVVGDCNSVEGVETLASSGIGGLILRSPSSDIVAIAEHFIREGTPVIAVFPTNQDDLYPYTIDMDNLRAGQIVAELFIKNDRRRIMCITYEQPDHWEEERVSGLESGYGSAPMRYALPRSASADDATIIADLAEVLRANRPDAVMCAGSGGIFYINFAIDALGLHPGVDLDIIGFDCHSFYSSCGRYYSEVGISWWDAGQTAAEGILDMLHGRSTWTEPKKLQPSFVPGYSTPEGLRHESTSDWYP